jgi:hypothetical protein
MGAIKAGERGEISPWESRRLWSLWDMVREVWVGELCQYYARLTFDIQTLIALQRSGRHDQTINPAVGQQYFEHSSVVAKKLREHGGFRHFCETAEQHTRRAGGDGSIHWNVTSVLEALVAIKQAFSTECNNNRWVKADVRCQFYFVNPHPWGRYVYNAFPSLRDEIRDAGQALGLGMHNAAVYHSMRIAEKGLRTLARHLKANVGAHPIDHAQWDAIIKALRKRLETMPGPRSTKRQETLKLYGNLVLEAHAFKDAYRNHVSHSMVKYDELQAQGVLNHTAQFMQQLATRMHERGGKVSKDPAPLLGPPSS